MENRVTPQQRGQSAVPAGVIRRDCIAGRGYENAELKLLDLIISTKGHVKKDGTFLEGKP